MGGHIENYVSYASGLTSAPEVFHEAIAHLQISALLHRNVCLPMDFGHIRPNLWVLLVGPSTRTKKSTAINIGYEIIHAVDDKLRMPYDFSPEALMMGLSSRNPCRALLVREEIGGLISAMNKKAYMSDIKDLLMHIYDCPDMLERTLMKKNFRVNGAFLSILGATTPQRLQTVATETDVADGFLARFMVCFSDEYRFRPVRMRENDDKFVQAKLINDLRKVKEAFADRIIEYRLDDQALEAYNKWLKKIEAIKTDSPVIGRLATYVLKLSITHNVSDDIIPKLSELSYSLSSPLDIYPHNIEYATEFVNNRLETTFELFRELGNSGNLEKVKDIIYTQGPIGHSNALRKSKLKARMFRECRDTLIEARQIEIVRDEKGNTSYRKFIEDKQGGPT